MKIKNFFNSISTKVKPYVPDFFKAVCGALAICLGTYASKMCPYPILSPLLFSVGIALVMVFDFHLITRHFPTQKLDWIITPLIIVVNYLAASFAGMFFEFPYTPPEHYFLWSIVGGIVIGLVSVNNLVDSKYKAPVFLLLMYIFVMLGLPHVVVISFLNAEPPIILTVLVGNIIGGLMVRLMFTKLLKTGEK